MSTKFNLIFKKFHPILGGVFQTVPLFYIEGCASRNNKQINTKYELDYGIGLRFLNIGVTFDTSLFRIGKNLDDINSSVRIIFWERKKINESEHLRKNLWFNFNPYINYKKWNENYKFDLKQN